MGIKQNISSILNKRYIPYLLISVISVITFLPSFSLAFTGDDYLTLWRYNYNFPNGFNLQNNFKYLLSDYGPQDTLFAFLTYIFGLKPFYFFFTSFIIRLLAALSIYQLVLSITKKKNAAFISSLFFSVTVVGLETTNWVFNMPSYFAIIFLNLFLINYNKIVSEFNIKLLLISMLFYCLTLLSQPIRMLFLPLFLFIFETYLIVRKRYSLKLFFKRLFPFILIFILTFTLGKTGDSVSPGANFFKRLLGFKNAFTGGYSDTGLIDYLKNSSYYVFFYNIGQFGKVFIVENLIPERLYFWSTKKTILGLIAPIYIFANIVLMLLKVTLLKSTKRVYKLSQLLILLWTLLLTSVIAMQILPYYDNRLGLNILAGGYILIYLGFIIFTTKSKLRIEDYLAQAVILILVSYLLPWIRNPVLIQESYHRYLVVASAGLATISGLIFTISKRNLFLLYFVPFLIFHLIATASYFSNLNKVRNASLANSIRRSIPVISTFGSKETTTLVYLSSDNKEVLQETLYFGFPVIMSFEQKFDYIWNIAYTDNWEEVKSAYLTGESLKRFGTITVTPVDLNNIYSFYVTNGNVVNTTNNTREKLLLITL